MQRELVVSEDRTDPDVAASISIKMLLVSSQTPGNQEDPANQIPCRTRFWRPHCIQVTWSHLHTPPLRTTDLVLLKKRMGWG